MKELKASILVPTLGERKEEIVRLLNSLLAQTYKNLEVIMISQDNYESTEKICTLYKRKIEIRHIFLEQKGLSLARNTGLQYVSGDVIILSDDDCWYPKRAVENILKYFKKYKWDILLTQIYDPYKKVYYKNYSNRPQLINNSIELLSRSSIEIAFRNIPQIELFDEKFGLGARYICSEEIDFLIRNFRKNMCILYVPRITVYHRKKKSYSNKKQVIAKGAFYRKNFNIMISFIVLLRDYFVKHEKNLKNFLIGYFGLDDSHMKQ